MLNNQCKRCRRLRQKLFLKGEKCFSPKCPLIRKSYPPGLQGKRRTRSLSEYGRQLMEKQKLKAFYGVSEEQLRRYFKKAILKKGHTASKKQTGQPTKTAAAASKEQKKAQNQPVSQKGPANTLLISLEARLDSTVFNLGWASSRRAARQMVSHGQITVNGRPVNIPSQEIRVGDVLIIKKPTETISKQIQQKLKTLRLPPWLTLDKSGLSAKVLNKPIVQKLEIAVNMPLVIEYFSH